MALRVPTVRASAFSEFRSFLTKRGVAHDELLAKAGVSDATLSQPEGTLPLEAAFQLFELAARRTNDPYFGLHYAEAFPIGGSGLIGQLILTAPTIRDVIQALARYGRVYVDNAIDFEEQDGIGRLSWEFPPDVAGPRLQFTAFSVGLLMLRLKQASEGRWRPVPVQLAERAPDDISEYERVFAGRVQFDARSNEIVFDATTLARPIPQRILNLFKTLQKVGDTELAAIERTDDVVANVRHAIAARFGTDQSFDLETIAGVVGLPSRALQWRLGQRETSYERILSEARRDTAARLLRDTDRAMTDIAAHLRFSELSAFTRASQRWFEMSPTAYRHHLRK